MAHEKVTYHVSELLADNSLVINDGFRAKNSQLNSVEGLPFARAGNINGGFDFDGADRVNPEEAHKAGIKVSKTGDVVFTSKGTVGRFGYVQNDTPQFIYSPQLCFWRSNNDKLISPRFLYYWMHGPEFLSQIHALKGQTDMADYVSLRDQRAMKLSLPSLLTQKAIAHILGTLDDRIELNRRMNETLEAMAQALFKSWFVDFDPVIDNALASGKEIPEELSERAEARAALGDRRKPLPEAIRTLFPNEFIYSDEMGWIPKGWEAGRILDHTFIEMGQSPKGGTYNNEGVGIPLINGPVEFGEYFAKRAKWTTAPTKLSSPGDLIICVRGSTTGRYVKSDDVYCLGRGVCAFRAKSSQQFVDQLYKNHIENLLLLTTGSTFPNWSRETLSDFPTVLPPPTVITKYNNLTLPMARRQQYVFTEIANLAKLRDTLLPKLLSGEIRIPDAEKMVEGAVRSR